MSVRVWVRACGIKLSCYSLGAPVGRTLRSSRRPPLWRRLIWVGGDRGRGEPDNAPRWKAFLLSCFQPDRCQFKRGESEGAGERAGERWSGVEQRGVKGEERGRSVRVGLKTPPWLFLFPDWPSLLCFAIPPPRWESPVSQKANEGWWVYTWFGKKNKANKQKATSHLQSARIGS